MRYLKTAMVVPGKGMAWTMYEIDDKEEIQRILTHIPETGEITRFPNPKMKKLFQPERLDEAAPEEFLYVWDSEN